MEVQENKSNLKTRIISLFFIVLNFRVNNYIIRVNINYHHNNRNMKLSKYVVIFITSS